MKMLKTVVFLAIFGMVGVFGSEIGQNLSVPGAQDLIPSVEARVGRPLTPVSVAGVARRSVRRCAVGVYHCRLAEPQSQDGLLGMKLPEPVDRRSPDSLLPQPNIPHKG